MIDLAMLDELARQIAGRMGSRRPPELENVFARIVADGWAPRSPAFGEELARLEVSTARGKCLEPLIVEGDELYVDPRLPPKPGDLVSFQLSERGAAAQNSALPPGQSPWRAGDRWTKLLVPYRGIAMLLENHGGAATTTLLAGESADAAVALWPVRQIRRASRLLFTPDVYSPQIGIDAASQIFSVVVAGAVQLNLPVGSTVQDVDVITGTIITTGRPIAVDASTFFSIGNSNNNAPNMCKLTVRRDGSDVGTAIFDGYAAWLNANSSGQRSWNGQVTLTITDAPAAGSHTYAFHITGSAGGTAGASLASATNTTFKIREIKR
jgi:hypothetical protein